MGLKCSTFVLSPGLGMGITSAFFHESGKELEFIDQLKSFVSGVCVLKASLNTELLMLENPDDLLMLIPITFLYTSTSLIYSISNSSVSSLLIV